MRSNFTLYIYTLCRNISHKKKEQRKNNRMKINNEDFILTQYADDTTVILDGSEDSLKETLYELEEFVKESGLKAIFDSIQTKWKLH